MRKFARKILTKLDIYEDFELNEDTVVVCNDCGAGFLRDDNYYTIQNSDEKLCSDSWVEEYDTEGGACRHILEFTKGKQGGKEVLSGKETFIVTTTGNTKTDTHDFTWKWIDNSREGLILNYGSGDVKIFENVWVREHYLSGKLDGEIMMLTASRYMVNQNWK